MVFNFPLTRVDSLDVRFKDPSLRDRFDPFFLPWFQFNLGSNFIFDSILSYFSIDFFTSFRSFTVE